MLTAKKFEHVYVKMRLTDNIEYFDKVKGKKEENAQILIAYHWKEKIARLRYSRRTPEKIIKPVKEEKRVI